MPTRQIQLPDRLDASRVRKLVHCANEIRREGEIVVDASSVVFAFPYGVVALGAALLQRGRFGFPPATYTPPRDTRAKDFLREVGFDELVNGGHATPVGTLAIRRLASNTMHPAYPHEVGQLIEANVPRTSESVAFLVTMSLNEMLQNVVEHAHSSTDAVVLSRWYARDENVRIAIADSGIGFAASLRRNHTHDDVADDRILIRRAATVEGTTGRTAERFGGLGLKTLRTICIHRGGSVHITSHTVDAEYSVSQNRESFVPRLHGSIVEIDFRPKADDGSTRDELLAEDFF